jgi:hypothetical protein
MQHTPQRPLFGKTAGNVYFRRPFCTSRLSISICIQSTSDLDRYHNYIQYTALHYTYRHTIRVQLLPCAARAPGCLQKSDYKTHTPNFWLEDDLQRAYGPRQRNVPILHSRQGQKALVVHLWVLRGGGTLLTGSLTKSYYQTHPSPCLLQFLHTTVVSKFARGRSCWHANICHIELSVTIIVRIHHVD